jgi:putative transposon-encoded protein
MDIPFKTKHPEIVYKKRVSSAGLSAKFLDKINYLG